MKKLWVAGEFRISSSWEKPGFKIGKEITHFSGYIMRHTLMESHYYRKRAAMFTLCSAFSAIEQSRFVGKPTPSVARVIVLWWSSPRSRDTHICCGTFGSGAVWQRTLKNYALWKFVSKCVFSKCVIFQSAL